MQKLKKITFDALPDMKEGLVLLGCSNPQEWADGITKMLQSEGIANIPIKWKSAGILTTTGGRTDVVLVFPTKPTFNMGKLAIWRINFGDVSWLSDYVTNYAKQHGR